jgi:beta-phosphoglucomutase-like phosphatase (HAD superfamily)
MMMKCKLLLFGLDGTLLQTDKTISKFTMQVLKKCRELLGKDHVRGEQLPIDGYHLTVHVWIRNANGQYLILRRAANRPTYPLMWECVGGSVVKGENSL